MQITSIQITRRDNTGTKLKATVSVVLDDMVVIHDIKVLDNAGTFFLAMPSKSTKAGTFKDIVHPINQDVRKVFEHLIISAYKRSLDQNCSKMELRFSQQSGIGLLEQSFEMFEVTNTSSHIAQIGSNSDSVVSPISRPLQSLKSSSDTTSDDELLKWLES